MNLIFSAFMVLSLAGTVANAEICGKTDDRYLTFDSKVGRMSQAPKHSGCVATLISNKCVITYGACATKSDYVEFNVPMSVAGVPQASSGEDTYMIDKTSVKYEARGIGQQWAVMKLKPNSITGKLAGDVQGYYRVATKKSQAGDPIRVVQYTYALNDTEYVRSGEVAPNTQGDLMHFAQTTSRGKLVKAGIFLIPEIIEHDADTSYGSGGAPVINERTNEIVGIDTHGGCKASYVVTAGARYTNSGTSTTGSNGFKKAMAECMAQ